MKRKRVFYPPPNGEVIGSASDDYERASRASNVITKDKYTRTHYSWDFTKGQLGWQGIPADASYDEYNNIRLTSDTIISPELDLTSFKNPTLRLVYGFDKVSRWEEDEYNKAGDIICNYTFCYGKYYISVSSDGQSWHSLLGDLLPSWTKYIRIIKRSYSLKELYIADLSATSDFEMAIADGATLTLPEKISKDLTAIDINKDGKIDYMSADYVYYASDPPSYISQGDGYVFLNIAGEWKDAGYTTADKFSFLNELRNSGIYVAQLNNSILTFSYPGFKPIDCVENGRYSTLFPFDKDNDGQTDFLSTNDELVYTIGVDGKIYKEKLNLYVPPVASDVEEETTGYNFITMDYSQLSPAYMSSQMFGRDGVSSGSSGAIDGGQFLSADINGDAIPDLVNFNSGVVYFGLPDGRFMKDSFNGQLFFADFNGDGRDDYVLYKDSKLTVHIVQPEGGTKSKDIISGFTCSNIWCRDVDKDGDPDIVIALNGSSVFLAVLENDGKGSFRRHEAMIADKCGNFTDCMDFDSDGNYEVLTDKSFAYRINGTNVNTTAIDMSSLTNISVNQRPSAPKAAPEIVSESSTGLLKISWGEGSDKETPQGDLTYSLRIGSQPGSDDILSAGAFADGTRYNAVEGNMARLHQRIINTKSWPSGRYYISVQAVDRNYLGSSFSPEATFDKKVPDNDFFISSEYPINILDTVTVVAKSPSLGHTVYNWDFDGGRLVASDESVGVYKVVYETPGTKLVTLRTTDSQGRMSDTSGKEIKISRSSIHAMAKPAVSGKPIAALDIDEDGIPEYYCEGSKGAYGALYNRGYYQRDGKGGYVKIPKMFNSQGSVNRFDTDDFLTVDLNGDGMCDVWAKEYEQWSTHQSINLGDMDMETSQLNSNYMNPTRIKEWHDFNNDGKYDVVAVGSIWINDGTYTTFSKPVMATGSCRYDFDGDGLVDIISLGQDYDSSGNLVPSIGVYLNKGDCTVRWGHTQLLPGDMNISSSELLAACDFDNNGKCDFLLNQCIVWDDGEITELSPEIDKYNFKSGQVIDIDNNGYMDICCKGFVHYLAPGREIMTENYEDDEYGTDYSAVGNYFVGPDGKLVNGYNRLAVFNEAPTAPTDVRHTQNSEFVTVEWTHAIDKETPSMHMRYNISIKKAGKEGEDAYLFSPGNSGKDNVPIPSRKPLIQGNCLKIPVANIPAGDYEVKVQARDQAYASSPFSKTYLMHVDESASFELPATGEVNVAVPVRLLINTDLPVDYDGGIDNGDISGIHQIVWATPGVKTLRVGDASASIYIQPAPDGSFNLPEKARRGDRIDVEGLLMNSGGWTSHELVNTWSPGDNWIVVENKKYDCLKTKMVELVDGNNIVYIPSDYGSYRLKHAVNSQFSTQVYSHDILIEADPEYTGNTYANIKAETLSTLSIDGVTVDGYTGKYKIQWQVPVKHRPEAIGINVYRETSRSDRYELLATLPLTATEYIDNLSAPDVKAERYVLGYKLSYGTSRYSKAHQPVHVMINRGAGSSWNLIWGSYTGTTVSMYRILRGSSPESLQVVAEVSGHVTSYTDFSAPATGALYYAVETVIEQEEIAVYSARYASRSRVSRASGPRSNVVAAAGGNISLATSVRVFSENGITNIDAGNDTELTNGLQMVALISPNTATFARVNWTIESGNDVVTVDQLGRVRPTGKTNGAAVVRAMTLDGSGVYADIIVTVDGVSGLYSVLDTVHRCGSLYANPSPATIEVTISGLPENGAELSVFSMSGKMVERISTTGESVMISCERWSPGFYIAQAVDYVSGKVLSVKFIKK